MAALAPEFNGLLPRAVATVDMQKAKDLLHGGVDVNDRDAAHGWTGLIWSALLGRADFANLLLDRGADINLKAPENGWTALMFAAHHGEFTIARLLVERGADPGIKNHQGLTAPQMAKQCGHDNIADYLQDLIDTRQRRQEKKFQRLRDGAAKRKFRLESGS
jgi:ankyrin repeat protein